MDTKKKAYYRSSSLNFFSQNFDKFVTTAAKIFTFKKLTDR
ncbi:hypothetical protein FEDK69T_24890 [Flavobacterium enshiense DK69]|nr:hypothetical protein FEDK69T_24890 [Flavobacterium enshiense DK69]